MTRLVFALGVFLLVMLFVGTAPWLYGQDQKAEVQKKLDSQFTLTKTTADRTDILTAGAILVLQKDGLLMYSVDTKAPPTSTYKNGKLSFGFGDKFATCFALSHAQPQQNCDSVPQRKFVAGEKFWVVGSAVKDDGVIFVVYSDPYSDVRYYGQVKFPFQKHNIPPADDVMKTIAEVLIVEPPDNSSAAAAPPGNVPAGTSAAPDAPPVAPRSIALGQTKDEVVAAFGQPQKIVNLGAKELYLYPDMKVTFLNGKVADVQ
jgi:hypothetical protein